MSYLWKRLLARWAQYRTETAMLVTGFLGLIVNLACMKRLLSPRENRIIVLVDSYREATLLRLLDLATLIPRCRVRVIRQTDDFRVLSETGPGGEALLVATSRLYSKHYQVLAGMRRRLQLIVL